MPGKAVLAGVGSACSDSVKPAHGSITVSTYLCSQALWQSRKVITVSFCLQEKITTNEALVADLQAKVDALSSGNGAIEARNQLLVSPHIPPPTNDAAQSESPSLPTVFGRLPMRRIPQRPCEKHCCRSRLPSGQQGRCWAVSPFTAATAECIASKVLSLRSPPQSTVTQDMTPKSSLLVAPLPSP